MVWNRWCDGPPGGAKEEEPTDQPEEAPVRGAFQPFFVQMASGTMRGVYPMGLMEHAPIQLKTTVCSVLYSIYVVKTIKRVFAPKCRMLDLEYLSNRENHEFR